MTTGEPELNQAPQATLASKPPSIVRRLGEWFWRGATLRETQRAMPEPSARAQTLAQRARSSADLALNCADLARSAEIARSSITSAEPLETLAEVTTSELYRQSAYWALCSLAARSDELAGTSYDEAVWDTLDEKLLTLAAGNEQRVAPLRTSLRGGSFVYFAELPASEQPEIAKELAKLSAALIAILDQRTQALQSVLVQRAWRLSLVFPMLLLAFAVFVWQRKSYDARHDLAEGRSWRASSKYETLGCDPPDQVCAKNASAVFFSTNEEKDPWIEFDLDTVRTISAVQADNRVDCCQERAIPLIVEVSENHKRWTTVARRDSDFTSWRASFTPVKARWVRLRVARVSLLHLSRVRIIP